MTSSRDQPKKHHPAPPDSVPDQDYVSAEDLFGELVDAPMPSAPTPARQSRPVPVKGQVTDPRPWAKATRSGAEPAASDTEPQALPSRIEPFKAPAAPPAPAL